MPLLDYSLTDSSTANEQAPTRPLRLLNCSPFCSSLVLFKTLEQRGCFSFGIRWHKNLWLSKHQRDKELVLSVDFSSILWQEVLGCFLFLRNMNALCIWCLAWHLTSFSFLLSSAFCYPCCCRWSSALDGLCIKVKISFSQNLPPRNREFDDTPCSNSISRFDMVTGEFDDMPHPESGDCLRQSRDEMSLRKMDEQLP